MAVKDRKPPCAPPDLLGLSPTLRALNRSDLPKVFLLTGDGLVMVKPTVVTTILGSCVAMVLHCRARGVGAICHCLLPDSVGYRRAGVPDPQPCRFVDTALPHLLRGLERLGIRPPDLTAKLFGGASGLAGDVVTDHGLNIGWENVVAARAALQDAGLPPACEDVGGRLGRKIVFFSSRGDVWLKRVNSIAARAR